VANPLADEIRGLIETDGPILLSRFMALALGHPVHGYYRNRDPLGAAGDFITAPEVSQMFGEMIGLWSAVMWQGMGAPPRFILAELGPGRGTLMADAVRAMRQTVPGCADAAEIHLVETSRVLRAKQAETLEGLAPAWHDGVETLPSGPAIIIANEFFDALPVLHLVYADGEWRDRLVAADGDQFVFVAAPGPSPLARHVPEGDADEGAIFECSPSTLGIAEALGARIAADGGAALIIDYGHAEAGLGETLQAVRGHTRHDPLVNPGDADLTAHVDFAAVRDAARRGGAAAYGPVTQGGFLTALGIEARRDGLLAGANAAHRSAIEAAYERLISPDAMGDLFKVLALTDLALDTPPGFPK
jgi:NADH dehydrogenase [ubiquinone] 1 alpha subcomplex assembly factor 7